MLADLRAAWRALRAAPGYALAAVCCLALGLGANAAVFHVADALFFRPPPGVAEAGRLVRVEASRGVAGMSGLTLFGVTRAEAARVAAARGVVAGVAAYEGTGVTLGERADARAGYAQLTAPGYWAALGVRLTAGRLFAPGEEQAGAPPAAVVSHRYWRTALGGDPRAVGRTLRVNGLAATVVGVAPPDFNGTELTPRVDVWLPVAHAAALRGEPEAAGAPPFPTLALAVRLQGGVTRATAEGAMRAALVRPPEPAGGMGMRFTRPTVQVAALVAGGDDARGAPGRLARWLAAVSALVLLVAAANVAGLALARGVARRRELAVRVALGAGRARLVRQLAAEGALVAAGGAAASAVVFAGVGALLRRFPALPEPPAPDARLAAFVLLLTALTAALCGGLPALVVTRRGLRGALHEASAAAAGASAGRARARELLLVGQLGLTTVLVAGAALFLRSLAGALAAPLGFDAAHVVAVSAMEGRVEGSPLAADVMERLRERAAALPGVRAAAIASPTPFDGAVFREFEVPGAPRAPGTPTTTYVVNADQHYVRAMGLRLARGRAFTAGDRPARGDDGAAVLVSESMARRDWPGQDPVGRCVRFKSTGGLGPCVPVAGVVADARTMSFREATGPTLYLPASRTPGPLATVFVRLAGPADAPAAAAVRRALAAAVPDAPPLQARPLPELLGRQLAPQRLGAALFTLYGALALLLAAVGLYGVVRYNAERRTRELAVRTALGARPADLARLVLGGGARLVAAGAALGAAGALAGARLLEGLLYGVRPADPAAVAGACAALALVALLASWLPARRAARSDPAAALRAE